jgi:hypothetical protein
MQVAPLHRGLHRGAVRPAPAHAGVRGDGVHGAAPPREERRGKGQADYAFARNYPKLQAPMLAKVLKIPPNYPKCSDPRCW